MKTLTNQRQNWIYLRLSREDLSDQAEPVALKLEKRKAIALGLAAQHDQVVPEENILLEVVSGKTIEAREQFQLLLENARAGRVAYLFTPYFDRILRGSKRDEAEAEEALKDGDVTVISTEGVFDFGDANFDVAQGLAFTVRNAVSRQYLYDLSKKLRETNLVRTKQGQRSAGFSPYGYNWLKPTYKNKTLVGPGRYEIVPEEYEVVVEIFERLWREGARGIAADLNERYRRLGYPVPPSAKNMLGWSHSSLYMMARNPFYAGFPAHRYTMKRKGAVLLDRNDWVFSNEQQPYEHPISLADWERLQTLISSRKNVGTPKTNKQAILTGVLCCSNGRFMTNRVGYYACTCREYATKHKGMAINEPKINQVAFDTVKAVIESLPETLLHRSPHVDSGQADREYRHAQSALLEARQLRDDLILHATTHLKIYGAEAYEKVCVANREKIEALEEQVAQLEVVIRAPKLADLTPLLHSVREFGFDTFWNAATVVEKRTILQTVIAKIILVEPEVKYIGEVIVEAHDWVSEYTRIDERVGLPLRVNRRD